MRGWHSFGRCCCWDVDAIAADFRHAFQYSECRCTSDPPRAIEPRWEAFTFAPAKDVVVVARLPSAGTWFLSVWAHSPDLARQHFETLRSRYAERSKRVCRRTNFIVLGTRNGFLFGRNVPTKSALKTDRDLSLHYGGDFVSWNAQFLIRLRGKNTGITILRGQPGTGKTSYLRFLTHKLRRTHRVYYLPLSVYPLLASPGSVDFWMSEHEEFSRMRKVVILEDAESLLMQRASDNQANVSNLLNVADGFLGELLRMQVICTINCPIERIDPAIVRPGRLLSSREFVRLPAAQAKVLAAAKNLSLNPQKDYSLAELYNGKSQMPEPASQLGFPSA
jgi:hypothetical protein